MAGHGGAYRDILTLLGIRSRNLTIYINGPCVIGGLYNGWCPRYREGVVRHGRYMILPLLLLGAHAAGRRRFND